MTIQLYKGHFKHDLTQTREENERTKNISQSLFLSFSVLYYNKLFSNANKIKSKIKKEECKNKNKIKTTQHIYLKTETTVSLTFMFK